MTLKDPLDCQSIEEIRNEIDSIDNQIINLFSERHKYVEEIVKYKNNEEGIIAQERKDHVIRHVAKMADQKGLNADLFRKIYTLLIEYNIQRELELLQNKKR